MELANRLRENNVSDTLSVSQLKVLCGVAGVTNKQGKKAALAQRIKLKLETSRPAVAQTAAVAQAGAEEAEEAAARRF